MCSDEELNTSTDVVALNLLILAGFKDKPVLREEPHAELVLILNSALTWELANDSPDMYRLADIRHALASISAEYAPISVPMRRGLYLLDTLQIVQDHKDLLKKPIMNRFGVSNVPPATAGGGSDVSEDLVGVYRRFREAASPYAGFRLHEPSSTKAVFAIAGGGPRPAPPPSDTKDYFGIVQGDTGSKDHCTSCMCITPHDVDRSRSATRTCLVCFATEKLTMPASSCHDMSRISQIARSVVVQRSS